MAQISCYAALSAKSLLTPYKIERRKIGVNDVQIAIDFCGVCNFDSANNSAAQQNHVETAKHYDAALSAHKEAAKYAGCGDPK